MTAAGLEVDEVTVRYGGHVAVEGASLRAPIGRITGLIGPNGAGKTTLFNACSGLVRVAAGRIALGGVDLTSLSPPRRAQLGLGRTFQRMELFDSLTVAENVALGREAADAGSRPLAHLRATRDQVEATASAVAAALDACGIGHLAPVPVVSLSTGQRRLVELARAMAGRGTLLLLDEPSSGLDHRETEAFGGVLRQLVAGGGLGILLVEHDMSLVMAVCDHLFVLDFGRMIFDGSAAAVAASPTVRQAYLGGEVDAGAPA